MLTNNYCFDVFANNYSNWSNLINEIKPKGIKTLNFIDEVNLIVGWCIKNNKKFILPSVRNFSKRTSISKSYVHELEHKFLSKFGFKYDEKNKEWFLDPKKNPSKINYKDIKLFIFSTRKFKQAQIEFNKFKKMIGVESADIDNKYLTKTNFENNEIINETNNINYNDVDTQIMDDNEILDPDELWSLLD